MTDFMEREEFEKAAKQFSCDLEIKKFVQKYLELRAEATFKDAHLQPYNYYFDHGENYTDGMIFHSASKSLKTEIRFSRRENQIDLEERLPP